MCLCFCCCGYIFRKINWHILSGFFPFFCDMSLTMVKTDVKIVSWRVLFFKTWPAIFFFFCICAILLHAIVGVFFKKFVRCVLSFWLVCVMLRSYMLMLFQYLWISSQIEPYVALCYHCMQTLELVQTKNSKSSRSVRFSSGVLNLSK